MITEKGPVIVITGECASGSGIPAACDRSRRRRRAGTRLCLHVRSDRGGAAAPRPRRQRQRQPAGQPLDGDAAAYGSHPGADDGRPTPAPAGRRSNSPGLEARRNSARLGGACARRAPGVGPRRRRASRSTTPDSVTHRRARRTPPRIGGGSGNRALILPSSMPAFRSRSRASAYSEGDDEAGRSLTAGG